MNLATKLTLKSINLYQQINEIIPRGILERGCRFNPTCSTYTYQAVLKYGTIKGLFLGFKRILRCHPFSKGGFDPIK